MGTRNLTIVKHDNEYRVAQYGQWDGYPSGNGKQILEFLGTPKVVNQLREALGKVRYIDWVSDKDRVDAANNGDKKWDDWGDNFLSRNVGADILQNIISSKEGEIVLKNGIDFVGDSLFCEYAYVIDLDINTFEVFEGFNKEVIVEGRFTSKDYPGDGEEYQPVKLLKSYSLYDLPTYEQFIKVCEASEEEDE